MRIFTIASGSSGNCTLICDGDTCILIDAGISARRIRAALDSFGLSPDQLDGILITHEHSDHICGLKTLIKHFDIPILAPRTVANHLRWSIAGVEDYIVELKAKREDKVGGLSVLPFHTPHDTPESVGYRITGSSVFGFCTDCGHITDEVLEGLCGSETAVIEANHNLDMLRTGPYPVMLKRRILSDSGHLSNDCCAELALKLYDSGTRQFILGHLSRENNTPELAYGSVSEAFLREGIDITKNGYLGIAPEKEILEVNCNDKDQNHLCGQAQREALHKRLR